MSCIPLKHSIKVYAILMLIYHIVEIVLDISEITNPHKTPPTGLREMFDHMKGYHFLLYVSLVVNLIIFITLCCLLVYTITHRAFFFKPFKYIYFIYIIFTIGIFLFKFVYLINQSMDKEPSDSDYILHIFIIGFSAYGIIFISFCFLLYYTAKKYIKFIEKEQKGVKCDDVSDFENV